MTLSPEPIPLPGIPVSAGALIYDRDRRLLILKPTYKSGWTIPGGVMEADGESPWEACQREVREETGLEVKILRPIGQTDYWFAAPGERVHKFVHFFLMEPTGGDVSAHDHEYDEVRWVPLAEARRILSFDTYRDVLDRAIAAAREAA